MRALPLRVHCLVASIIVTAAAHSAFAQTPASAPRTSTRGPAVRYAERSVTLAGGFAATLMPYDPNGSATLLSASVAPRFVVRSGLLVEPSFSASYFRTRETSGGTVQGGASWIVSPGLALGYVRALSDQTALTVAGGYAYAVSGSELNGTSTVAGAHLVTARAAVTFFVADHVFIEPGVSASVSFQDAGPGFVAGVQTQIGYMF